MEFTAIDGDRRDSARARRGAPRLDFPPREQDLVQVALEVGDLKHQKMILEGILKNEKQEISHSNDQLNFLHQEIESENDSGCDPALLGLALR